MKPDHPPEQLPKGSVMNMTDFLPDFEGGVAPRGGWDRVGAVLGNTYAAALAFAPFTAAVQLVGITDTGAVKQVPYDTDAAITARGTAQAPNQNPVFYRQLLYIPSNDGTTSVKSYNGSANAGAATGSPPAGMYACVYKDHLVLARSAANPQRVWFSNGGDAGVWDTAVDGQWLDVSHPITGIVTLRNMILVFSEEGVERIRGDIIPGVAGSDFVLEPLTGPGTPDAFSIIVTDEFCVYANGTGIHLTDGISFVNLSDQGGISDYWQKYVWPYDSSKNLAGGYHRGKYILAVHTSSTFVTCLVCDVKRRVWYEFTNIPAWQFATAPEGLAGISAGDLFFAERDASYLVNASHLFAPAGTTGTKHWVYTADGNSVQHDPRLRTGYFSGTPELKRIRNVYVTASHAGSETVTVYAYIQPSLAPAERVSLGAFASTTGASTRQRLPFRVNKRGYGIALDIEMTNWTGAYTFRLDRLEADMRPLEGSR